MPEDFGRFTWSFDCKITEFAHIYRIENGAEMGRQRLGTHLSLDPHVAQLGLISGEKDETGRSKEAISTHQRLIVSHCSR